MMMQELAMRLSDMTVENQVSVTVCIAQFQ